VASDVYSLGALLYELLTGQHPYSPERKSLAALEQEMLDGEPPPASGRVKESAAAKQLRGELDAILSKALRREPNQRYATADALAEDLQRHLQGERVLARPDSVTYRMRKVLRRYRVAFAATGAVLLAVVGGAGVSIVQAKRANDAAERARVVKEFVVDVFKVNVPGGSANAELRQLPAEMLLERGGKLIETRFAGQPELQAELYGVVGGIFSDMGASSLAVDYATRQIGALAAIDATSLDQGRAMLLLGRALLSEGRARDAEVRARRAQSLLATDPGLFAEASVLLAKILDREGKHDAAAEELTRAERRISQNGSQPSIGRAEARALRARQSADRGRLDEALPLYESAIEDAVSAEGAASRTAIGIRLETAFELIAFDRSSEASSYRDAALTSLRSGGRPGEIRAALEDARLHFAMADFGHISYVEATAAIEGDRALLKTMGTVPEPIRARMDLTLGSVYCFMGEVARGDALVSQAATVLRPLAETPGQKYALAMDQGYAAMLAGRHTEAEEFAQERLETGKEIFPASSSWAAPQYYQFALNLDMQGRFSDAEAFLAALPNIDVLLNGKTSDPGFSELMHFALARIRLDAGDPGLALAWKGFTGDDSEPFISQSSRLLIGEAECAAGRSMEGLPLLLKVIASFEPRVSANDPYLARTRAVSGQCALAAGQRKVAVQLAQQAREAFIAQPGVSPYFKHPLAKLESSLLVR
jgi:eukaryotic-like serine/threonine-protein kinase